MSKYIIDTETWANLFDVKSVGVYGIGNDIVTDEKTVWSRMFRLDELEELNSDYINENFGELQDEAYKQGYADAERIWRAPSSDSEFYQKGLEDGKKSTEKGCDGCKYYEDTSLTNPCSECTRAWKDHYTPAPHSDRIEVGDVIANNTEPELKVWVTALGEMGFCGMAITDFGSVKKGELYDSCSTKGWHKTGKHYDIASILEAMRE